MAQPCATAYALAVRTAVLVMLPARAGPSIGSRAGTAAADDYLANLLTELTARMKRCASPRHAGRHPWSDGEVIASPTALIYSADLVCGRRGGGAFTDGRFSCWRFLSSTRTGRCHGSGRDRIARRPGSGNRQPAWCEVSRVRA